MTERILCVDDDSNILLGYQRALRKRYPIEVALGGEEGLAAIRDQGPFAVLVTDMRMPDMNGVELLSRVRTLAPHTVRMMLTGNADQQTALKAVNQGQVFRFMTKPCPVEDFAAALEACLAQHRLLTAERELLSKTLSGSIKMLTDVLSLVRPTAFGRASRVRTLARKVAETMGEQSLWMIEIAALLSQLGCFVIPDEILARLYRGDQLTDKDERAFANHPQVGHDLLRSIPRLEGVAEIIRQQERRFCESGHLFDGETDRRESEEIPLGSRILKCVLDYDALVLAATTPELAVATMLCRKGWYDPKVLATLCSVLDVTEPRAIRKVEVHQLTDRMVIAADVRSQQGTVLCTRGQEVTRALCLRLRNYSVNAGLEGKIEVLIPIDLEQASETDEAGWPGRELSPLGT